MHMSDSPSIYLFAFSEVKIMLFRGTGEID